MAHSLEAFCNLRCENMLTRMTLCFFWYNRGRDRHVDSDGARIGSVLSTWRHHETSRVPVSRDKRPAKVFESKLCRHREHCRHWQHTHIDVGPDQDARPLSKRAFDVRSDAGPVFQPLDAATSSAERTSAEMWRAEAAATRGHASGDMNGGLRSGSPPHPPRSVTLRAHSWYEHALLLSHWPCVRDVTWCCSFEAGRRPPQPGCYAFNPINGFQLREDVPPCTFLLERELRMCMQVPPDFFELRCEGHDIFVNSDGILSQKSCIGDANVIRQTTVDA